MNTIPATSGIYRIVCTASGRFYLGSAINMKTRWAKHLYALRNNSHHTKPLQNAWNKYGESSFTFEVLEFTLPNIQVEREQYWLDKLKPFGKRGFNINTLANKPAFAPETCERIRLAKLGHTVSKEARSRISASKTGHTYTHGVYAGRMKTLIVTAPDGTEYVVVGIRKFCREHNLNASNLIQAAIGKRQRTHKGWKARFPEAD